MINFRIFLFTLSIFRIIKAEEIVDSNDLNKSVFSTVDENGNPIWVRLSPENSKVMSQNIHTSPVYGDALAHKLVPIQVISILGTPTMSNKTGEGQFLYEIPYAVQNAALMILAMAVKNNTPTAHNFLGDAFTSRFKYPQKAEECSNNGSNRTANTSECGEGYEKIVYTKTSLDKNGSKDGKEGSKEGKEGKNGKEGSKEGKNGKEENGVQEKNQKEGPSQRNNETSQNDKDNEKEDKENKDSKEKDSESENNSNSTEEEESSKKEEKSKEKNKKKEEKEEESSDNEKENGNNLFGRNIKPSLMGLPINN